MALFHIDALLASDFSHQIIKIDNIVLDLNMINPTCQKCTTTGQHQTDHGPTSCFSSKVDDSKKETSFNTIMHWRLLIDRWRLWVLRTTMSCQIFSFLSRLLFRYFSDIWKMFVSVYTVHTLQSFFHLILMYSLDTCMHDIVPG